MQPFHLDMFHLGASEKAAFGAVRAVSGYSGEHGVEERFSAVANKSPGDPELNFVNGAAPVF